MIERVAYLSLHTSPLTRPGTGNAGGMNVYVDELARTMADRGVAVDVFTRRADPDSAEVVQVVPGYRVIHIDAGPDLPLPIEQLTDHVFDFAERVVGWARNQAIRYDLVHSHYWLSGWAGLMVKRLLDIPLANSFHTLGRVKDLTRREDQRPAGLLRIAAEHEVIGGSDCVISATPTEFEDLLEHYGADPTRLCLNPPGINHELFSPGDRQEARSVIGVGLDHPLVLFVGRIQALKGVDVVIEAFAKVAGEMPDAQLLMLGGPSGPGGTAELHETQRRASELGVDHRIRWQPPVDHGALAAFYRAADVLIFPSRSESFGLVAVEAQACGTPVVAAAIGGLRFAVDDGVSGILIEGWQPGAYADAVLSILRDEELSDRYARAAVEHARGFSWEITADRLLELYDGITR